MIKACRCDAMYKAKSHHVLCQLGLMDVNRGVGENKRGMKALATALPLRGEADPPPSICFTPPFTSTPTINFACLPVLPEVYPSVRSSIPDVAKLQRKFLDKLGVPSPPRLLLVLSSTSAVSPATTWICAASDTDTLHHG